MTEEHKATAKKVGRRVMWSLIGLIYVGFPGLMLFLHRDTANGAAATQPALPAEMHLEDVVIEGPGGRWGKWDRREAIKFSLEQVDTQVTLFLGGAVAVVAALAKMTLDSVRGEEGKRQPLTRAQLRCVLLIFAFCSWSCFFGVQAKALFVRVADVPQFSIYADLGTFALHQIIWFFAALLVLALALVLAAWKRASD